MELHLIRHGKTLANESGLYCGQTDLPLSVNGAAKLSALKDQGIYPPSADLFFTSGLLRAEQTLDILYGKIDRVIIPGIAEYNFGLFEMKSYDELKDRDDYLAWITDKTGNIECPGGESRNQCVRRMILGYSGLLSTVQHSGSASALVVCHGGTIACVMHHLLPNVKDFYEWQPKPGLGYTLAYTGGRFQSYKNLGD